MNIYERLISILVEQRLDEEPKSKDVWSQTSDIMNKFKADVAKRKQKAKRTKPSVTRRQRLINRKKGRAARDALRQAELDRDYGDTGIMKGDRP